MMVQWILIFFLNWQCVKLLLWMLHERQQTSMSRPPEAQATEAKKWRQRRTYQGMKRLSEAQVRWLEAYNADREQGQEERMCACRRGRRRSRQGAGRGRLGVARGRGKTTKNWLWDVDSRERLREGLSEVGGCGRVSQEKRCQHTLKDRRSLQNRKRRQKNVFWRR